MAYTLDAIISCLSERRVRATAAAVAGVLGKPHVPVSLMAGRPKTPENSWVVAKDTEMPAGYDEAELAPRLANTVVIQKADKLREWLLRINCPQA